MSLRFLLALPSTESSRAIKANLARQSGVEVIAAAPCDGLELLLLLRRTEPEVLVIESEPSRAPALCDVAFGEYPHLRILAVSPDGRNVSLHWLKAESRIVSASALEEIADEIRTALAYSR